LASFGRAMANRSSAERAGPPAHAWAAASSALTSRSHA
jgi:hypothetical protein